MRRINPDVVKIIMILVTLLMPFGVYFWSLHGGMTIKVSIHAIVWGITPDGATAAGFSILDPYTVARGSSYGLFNTWFCIEVIRYSNNYTRKKAVIRSGIISILYPIMLAFLALPYLLRSTTLSYISHIPIQQAIGFAIMNLAEVPEPKSTWFEPRASNPDDFDIRQEV